MNQIRILRKFNCKQKIKYQQHIWLILRTQLVYQFVILLVNCIVTMSLYFHLSHLYTTEFWTSENTASSNFGLAISSLLMVAYTSKIQQSKGLLIKDLHFTMLFLHILICFVYSSFTLSFSYVVFTSVLGWICISISSFVSNVLEQKKLQRQIMQIQSDDRKTLKKHSQHNQHETSSLSINQDI